MALEQVGRVGIFFAENGDQYVGAQHLVLAGRLNVVQRTLQYPLETNGGLCIAGILALEFRHVVGQHLEQVVFQRFDIGAAGLEDTERRCVFEQSQQHVLDRQEFVTPVTRFLVSLADGEFKILAEHGSGPFQRALERVFLLARVFIDLGNFRFRDFVTEYAANALALGMHMQHHLGGAVVVHAKKNLQDFNNEIHRRVIVIEQDNAVHRRKRDFRPCFFQRQSVVFM